MPGYDVSCWDGKVIEARPGDDYEVELENGRIATACVSSELRMHCIKLLPNDMVVVEIEDGTDKGKVTAKMR